MGETASAKAESQTALARIPLRTPNGFFQSPLLPGKYHWKVYKKDVLWKGIDIEVKEGITTDLGIIKD